MNRFVLFLLLGSTGLCLAGENTRTTTFTTPEEQTSCPLGIEAAWTWVGARSLPIDSGKGRLPQTLEVTLRNRQPSTISRAVITVYGFPLGTLSTPAVVYPLGQNPAEIGKSFTITRTMEMGRSVTVTFSIPELVTVTGINLDGLVYGSSSTFERETGCQALNRGFERVPVSRW